MKLWLQIVAGLASILSLIGLAFAGWFVIQTAIAEEAQVAEQEIELVRQEAQYNRVEDGIWRLEHQLAVIEERREQGNSYPTDERREKQLLRTYDILLTQQETLLEKYEVLSK